MSDCDAILARIKKIAQGAALMTETDVNIKVLAVYMIIFQIQLLPAFFRMRL